MHLFDTDDTLHFALHTCVDPRLGWRQTGGAMCILPHVSCYLCAAYDLQFWVWKKELEIAETSKFVSPRDGTQMPLNDNAAKPSTHARDDQVGFTTMGRRWVACMKVGFPHFFMVCSLVFT